MKLGSLFSGTAQRFADHEAIVCGDRRITFAELDGISNRLANALRLEGISGGDRCVLFLPNCAELVEIVIAVLKAGGVVVPISPRLTAPELRFILNDCKPTFIFFSGMQEHVVGEATEGLGGIQRIVVGTAQGSETIHYASLIERGDDRKLLYLPLCPDDCLISYTSGTTGKPKGAISTHANIAFLAGYLPALELELTQSDIILVSTPMAHGTGIRRLGNLMLSGTKLVIMPQFNAVYAVDLIERESVTIVSTVPTIVRMLLPEFHRRPTSLASLRMIAATGEVFPVALKEALLAAAPHVGVYSYYASTEAGTISALRPEEQHLRTASIGRALPGIEVRFVDKDLTDVPEGDCGEIVVRCGAPGSFTVMRGYLAKSDQESGGFLQNGWLRTGDLGWRDEDGYLHFSDRLKDMVVSGGLNIYSKEIEIALASHPAVAEAAIIGIPDAKFGEAVVAYVELVSGGSVTPDELLAHCRSLIAGYKKPKHFRVIASLPRTSSGKVIKGALKELAACDPELSGSVHHPSEKL